MIPHAPMPTFYIPHGGGPCFFMDWDPADTWVPMGNWLKSLAGTLERKPAAILVISGHWETAAFAVTASAAPPLIYDYYGFPPHTYQLRYDAPGAPLMAARAMELLQAAGLPTGADPTRGLDHGTFIPFKLIYPDADIPIAQLSLHAGLDPALHLAAGRALAPLRDEDVLIVGSGMSVHNMRGYGDPAFTPASERFDSWLRQTVAAPAPERDRALTAWSEAPAARLSHPREEHLLPLMVAAGAAGTAPGRTVFSGQVMETAISGFRFG